MGWEEKNQTERGEREQRNFKVHLADGLKTQIPEQKKTK